MQGPRDVHEMVKAHSHIVDRIASRLELLTQLTKAESSLGRRTGQLQHRHGFGTAFECWKGRCMIPNRRRQLNRPGENIDFTVGPGLAG
jgi:hypothetical protein